MPETHECGIESQVIQCPNCEQEGVEYVGYPITVRDYPTSGRSDFERSEHSVTVREEVHHILRCPHCYWEYCWHNTADFRIFCNSVLKLDDAFVTRPRVPA